MKNPITTFNAWVLTKITAYLSSSEGFVIEESEYTYTGIKSIIRDAFGYRYEVHVKTLSRLTDNIQDTDEINPLFKKLIPDIRDRFPIHTSSASYPCVKESK